MSHNNYEELMGRHTELKLLCLDQMRHIALLKNARSEQQASQVKADNMIAELFVKVEYGIRELQKLRVDADASAKWWAMHEDKIKQGEPTEPPNSATETTINWDGRYGKSS